MLPLVLVVVLVVVAAVTLAFLGRRRRAATAARIAAASAPVPELSEDDIAWRIGLLDDRPLLLSEFFAGAELEAMEAADEEMGTSIRPILPVSPTRAPAPGTLAAAVADPIDMRPAAAVVATPAIAKAPKPVVRDEPGPSRRYRLWRDSATVVLGATLVVLLVTNFLPGSPVEPSRAGQDDPSSAAVAIIGPESPTAVDAPSSAAPSLAPTDAPTLTPTDAPTASPTAPPTPKPTPKPTPRPTPRPTHRVVQQQAPDPTPPPDAAPHAQADAQADAEAHAQADAEADRPSPSRSRSSRARRAACR